MDASLFVLANLDPGSGKETIRLCIPGIDDGSAIWLETTIDATRERALGMLPVIAEALKTVKIDSE